MKQKLIKAFFFIAIIATFIMLVTISEHRNEEIEQPIETEAVESEQPVVEPTQPIEPIEPVVSIEVVPEEEKELEEVEPSLISLGEFRLTAYCSCSKCCGKWALNRPIDENGNEIVYGSSGEVLIEGVSIAVDTKVIPHGTEVVINEHTYVAHDTGGLIKGNRIDIYMSNHQKAYDFAVQYAEVFVVAD